MVRFDDLSQARKSTEPVTELWLHGAKSLAGIEELTSLETVGLMDTDLGAECARLAELPELTTLQLGGDALLHLPPGRLFNLRHLNIRDTKIRSLPASTAAHAELRELIASPRNKLTVPGGFMANGADVLEGPPELLEHIAMRATETEGEDFVTIDDASRIPDSFGDPRHLKIDLPTFKGKLPQLAHLKHLQTLKIRTVDLASAFTALANARLLRELEVSGQCTALPDSLGGLTALTHLTLWAEGLEELPAALGHLINLEELIVGHGAKALPPEIAKCTALRRLVVTGDTRLCSELAACTALEELHASAKATSSSTCSLASGR